MSTIMIISSLAGTALALALLAAFGLGILYPAFAGNTAPSGGGTGVGTTLANIFKNKWVKYGLIAIGGVVALAIGIAIVMWTWDFASTPPAGGGGAGAGGNAGTDLGAVVQNQIPLFWPLMVFATVGLVFTIFYGYQAFTSRKTSGFINSIVVAIAFALSAYLMLWGYTALGLKDGLGAPTAVLGDFDSWAKELWNRKIPILGFAVVAVFVAGAFSNLRRGTGRGSRMLFNIYIAISAIVLLFAIALYAIFGDEGVAKLQNAASAKATEFVESVGSEKHGAYYEEDLGRIGLGFNELRKMKPGVRYKANVKDALYCLFSAEWSLLDVDDRLWPAVTISLKDYIRVDTRISLEVVKKGTILPTFTC